MHYRFSIDGSNSNIGEQTCLYETHKQGQANLLYGLSYLAILTSMLEALFTIQGVQKTGPMVACNVCI